MLPTLDPCPSVQLKPPLAVTQKSESKVLVGYCIIMLNVKWHAVPLSMLTISICVISGVMWYSIANSQHHLGYIHLFHCFFLFFLFLNSYGGQLHMWKVDGLEWCCPWGCFVALWCHSHPSSWAVYRVSKVRHVRPNRGNLIFSCAYHTQHCAYYESRTHTALYLLCSASHAGWKSGQLFFFFFFPLLP